jgi:hypothetical protein
LTAKIAKERREERKEGQAIRISLRSLTDFLAADGRSPLQYAFAMGSHKLSIAAAAVFLVSSLVAAQQAGTAPAVAPIANIRVTIQVTDPSGAGIPQAQVRVIPAPDADVNMETDNRGQLTLDLKPGGYAVFVRAAAFNSVVTHMDVRSDPQSGKATQTFPVALRIAGGSSVEVQGSKKDDLLLFAYPYHDSLAFSSADLKALPHITVTVHNPHSNADETYSGVRLADLLGKAGAPLGSELRGEALGDYIVATGADGYRAVFALAEVDPSFHPGEVLVADAMNGKPLDAHTGPFRLVVTEDKRPARYVRNLATIELKSVP